MKPYQKFVTYLFTPLEGRDPWEILCFEDDYVQFEETRKNGQEDCHMFGEANKIGGKWTLTTDTRECIDMYGYSGEADAIEAYFNEHGMPRS